MWKQYTLPHPAPPTHTQTQFAGGHKKLLELGKILKIGGNKAIFWLEIPPIFGGIKGQRKSL